MQTDKRGCEEPVPVMEYGREGDQESRSAKARWLLGGMLIYLLAMAISGLAEAGATLAVSMLSVAGAIAGLVGAGVGLGVFVAALVALVAYASKPGGGPALFRAGRPVLASAVVICVVLLVAMVLWYGARMGLPMIRGVGSMRQTYQIQSWFQLLRMVLFPLGVVVVIAVIRKQ